MTEPQTTERDTSTACHVVTLFQRASVDKEESRCDTLPSEDRHAIAAAAATWRDRKYAVKRLAEVMRSRDLPGIAVVYHLGLKRRMRLPQPIAVPFEPIPLDETHPVLGQLLEIEPSAQEGAQGRPRPRDPFRRFLLRIGLPGAIVVNVLVQAGLQVSGGEVTPWRIGWAASAVFGILGLVWFFQWLIAAEWLIVPGGAFMRRPRLGRHKSALTRYTPKDTLLITNRVPHGFQLEFWPLSASKSVRHRVTDLELAALLAAWQSALTPPPLAQMRDFEPDV